MYNRALELISSYTSGFIPHAGRKPGWLITQPFFSILFRLSWIVEGDLPNILAISTRLLFSTKSL
jgi:hypothetical protein